jgi:hypothetical protein
VNAAGVSATLAYGMTEAIAQDLDRTSEVASGQTGSFWSRFFRRLSVRRPQTGTHLMLLK